MVSYISCQNIAYPNGLKRGHPLATYCGERVARVATPSPPTVASEWRGSPPPRHLLWRAGGDPLAIPEQIFLTCPLYSMEEVSDRDRRSSTILRRQSDATPDDAIRQANSSGSAQVVQTDAHTQVHTHVQTYVHGISEMYFQSIILTEYRGQKREQDEYAVNITINNL